MGFYVLLLDFYDLSSAASSGVADHVISACIARRFAGRRGWMHHAGITESIFEKYAQVDAQQNQISCHLTIDNCTMVDSYGTVCASTCKAIKQHNESISIVNSH
jgi:hypothetical protein